MTFEECVEQFREIDRTSRWALGDLAAEVEKDYGKNRLGEFAEKTGTPLGTVRELRRVSRAYPEMSRRPEISWSVFAALAALPDRVKLTAAFSGTLEDARKLARSRREKAERQERDQRARASAGRAQQAEHRAASRSSSPDPTGGPPVSAPALPAVEAVVLDHAPALSGECAHSSAWLAWYCDICGHCTEPDFRQILSGLYLVKPNISRDEWQQLLDLSEENLSRIGTQDD